jgi:predicted metalloprotease with PDZ domain
MPRLAALGLLVSLCAQAQVIELRVDASQAARRLFHAHMTMPVTPGEVALEYPEWIPGNHRPTGPIADVVGIRIRAAGRELAWKRDPVNLYRIAFTAPAGIGSVDVDFDLITPPSGGSTSPHLAILNWNQVLMYPAGKPSDAVEYRALLQVPSGWRYATALPVARESGDTIEFSPASLTTVVDSPVLMGRYFRTWDLSPGETPGHSLHVAADSPAALNASEDKIEKFRNLVKETYAAFGARHYRSYHFLLSLSEQTSTGGLEHHESSDNRLREGYFTDDAQWRNSGSLLAHEMVHSWNGKYRRPDGLATGGFSKPMEGELLWVYEGLTRYLGDVFATRAGIWTPQQWRERIAMLSANLEVTTGRNWRPLADTAVSVSLLNGARNDWRRLRRSTDYYDEGALVWLEADVLIRKATQGQKSLDTFLASFFGGAGGKPDLKPYTRAELEAALYSVHPYDWHGFFEQRIYAVAPQVPLGGVEAGGWKLVYRDEPTAMFQASESGGLNQLYSAGWTLSGAGVITDIVAGSPADQAKLIPQMQIVAVNGRQFSMSGIRAAIREARDSGAPIELIVRNGDFYSTHLLAVRTGPRYPDLERQAALPDLLSEIVKPRAR